MPDVSGPGCPELVERRAAGAVAETGAETERP